MCNPHSKTAVQNVETCQTTAELDALTRGDPSLGCVNGWEMQGYMPREWPEAVQRAVEKRRAWLRLMGR